MNRRAFLQMLGVSALATRAAHAQVAPPRRVIFFFTQHGVAQNNFWFRKQAMPFDQDWDFPLGDMAETEFSPSLRPLWRHRNKMTVLEGLSYQTGMDSVSDNGHARGAAVSLTGAHVVDDRPAVASVDQIIAQSLRVQNPSLTDLVSLTMANWPNNNAPNPSNFYRDATGVHEVTLMNNVAHAFGDIFGNVMNAGPAPLNRRQMFETVAAQYDRLKSRMSSLDQARVEAHRAALADLARRTAVVPSAACTKPTTPTSMGWVEQLDAWGLLTASAFACDMTRVATIIASTLPAKLVDASLPYDGTYFHDYVAHAETLTRMTAADQIHAGVVARLADQLEQRLDADGSTLLDNTAIVWCGEIATGGHSIAWPHFVILGGLGGAIRAGRYVHKGEMFGIPQYHNQPTCTMHPLQGNVPDNNCGTPHTRLLTFLADAMGADPSLVGDATLNTKSGGVTQLRPLLTGLR